MDLKLREKQRLIALNGFQEDDVEEYVYHLLQTQSDEFLEKLIKTCNEIQKKRKKKTILCSETKTVTGGIL